jgi:DNA polymerase III epsilon subunit-like protein
MSSNVTGSPPKEIQSAIYWNREEGLEGLVRGRYDERAPLTPTEWKTLPSDAKNEIWDAVQQLEPNTFERITSRQRLQGRMVGGTAKGAFLQGDSRRHGQSSGVLSDANLVDPLFSRAVAPDDDPSSFVFQKDEAFAKAHSFLFVKAFELEDPKDVKKMIAKAKEGCQVVVLTQPGDKAIRPKQQKEMIGMLRRASVDMPTLQVLEADILPVTQKRGFEQIMHNKQIIYDTPDGIPVNISSGINLGTNSPNNYDSGTLTRGVAALDVANRFLSTVPRDMAGSVDMSRIPDVSDVRKKMEALAKKEGRELTTVEIGGSGKQYVEPPVNLNAARAMQLASSGSRLDMSVRQLISEPRHLPNHMSTNEIRALVNGGRPVQVWARDLWADVKYKDLDEGAVDALKKAVKANTPVEIVFPPGASERRMAQIRKQLDEAGLGDAQFTEIQPNPEMVDIVKSGLQRGSLVHLTTPLETVSRQERASDPRKRRQHDIALADGRGWRSMFDELKQAGANIVPKNEMVKDESYRRMVYRELQTAIDRKESIDFGAFALSDRNTILMLIQAHHAGCKVRGIVDDLEIDKSQINRKGWVALSQAGIPIRVFTDLDADRAVDWSERPHDVKAHLKTIVLGLERGDGGEPEPRILKASANLSKAGFENNIEGGALIHSPQVARAVKEKLIDPLYEVSSELQVHAPVPLSERQPFTKLIDPDAELEGQAVDVGDFEGMGLAAHLGDQPLSWASSPYVFDGNQNLTRVEDLDPLDLYMDLPSDELGRFQYVPSGSFDVHGINRRLITPHAGDPKPSDKLSVEPGDEIAFNGRENHVGTKPPNKRLTNRNGELFFERSVRTNWKKEVPVQGASIDRLSDDGRFAQVRFNATEGRTSRPQVGWVAVTDLAQKPQVDDALDFSGTLNLYRQPHMVGGDRPARRLSMKDGKVTMQRGEHWQDAQPVRNAKFVKLSDDGKRGQFTFEVGDGKDAKTHRGWAPIEQIRVAVTEQHSSDDELDRTTIDRKETIPIAEAFGRMYNQWKAIEDEHGSVLLAGQNFGRYDAGVLNSTSADPRFAVDGVNRKFDAPFADTLVLSRDLFEDERSHNLDALSQRLGHMDGKRGTHLAAEDTHYTALALSSLAKMSIMREGLESVGVDGAWVGRLVSASRDADAVRSASKNEIRELIVKFFASDSGLDALDAIDGFTKEQKKELREAHPDDRTAVLQEYPLVQKYADNLAPEIEKGLQTAKKITARVHHVMPKDKLWFAPGDSLEVYGSESMSSKPMAKLSYDDDLRLEQLRSSGEGRKGGRRSARRKKAEWQPPAKVNEKELRIVGMTKDAKAFEVEIVTGSGKNPDRTRGWVPTDQVKISQPGPYTYKARMQGVELTPTYLFPGAAYRGEEAPRLDS